MRDNDDNCRSSSRSTRITLYMSGRLERRRGRGSLTLLHLRCVPFWGMLTSSSFVRRLHPLGGTHHFYNSWSIVGVISGRHSMLVSIYGIIPWRIIFILSLSCLGGVVIGPTSFIYHPKLRERPKWNMCKVILDMALFMLCTSRLLVASGR